MVNFLTNWVTNIIILAFCITILEILVPSGKVKKFVTLTAGFILIIAIIRPFLGFVENGIDLKEFQIASSNYIDKRNIQESSKVLEAKQIKQITEVYRNKLIEQIEASAGEIKELTRVKADVIINEDYASENFGEIRRVYLTIGTEETEGEINPVISVEKIEISTDEMDQKPGMEVDEKIKSQVEHKIQSTFDISKENIVINTN